MREKIWKANSQKAFGDVFDNSATIFKTVRLRHERAQLLGYKTHAHYVIERRMAEKPENVMTFLHELRDLYKPAALKELEAIKDFARADGVDEPMQWDVAYYAEKLREKTYAFSAEDLRPYFPLERVLEGTFGHFSKLFGLKFTPAKDLPVWHSDVTAYDERCGYWCICRYALCRFLSARARSPGRG